MNYKKLIETMRSTDPKEVFCASLDAADTIETLLAERDAAVKELHGRCSKCEHFSSGLLDFPCTDCRFEGGANDHWQWRGPQKEGGEP